MARQIIISVVLLATLLSCAQQSSDIRQYKPNEDELLKKAESGDVESQFQLGVLYDRTYGPGRDVTKIFSWYEKAAKQGHPEAQYNLGKCYLNGVGVNKSESEALKWLQKAHEKGHYDAGNIISDLTTKRILRKAPLKVSSMDELRQMAESGDAEAQVNLGICYRNGQGVRKDLEESFKWSLKSANQGHLVGQNAVGNCYNFGMGVDRNLEEAFKWYRKSAEQGHLNAQINLANCYSKGEGVEKDAGKAFEWKLKAAEQNDAEAQYDVGSGYYEGRGIEKNKAKAMEWYLKSAKNGYAKSQHNIGVYYLELSKDKNSDYKKDGVKWLIKSAEQGLVVPMFIVGVCYAKGDGVPQSKDEAIKWFRKAAERDHPEAKRALQQLEKESVEVKDVYDISETQLKEIEEAENTTFAGLSKTPDEKVNITEIALVIAKKVHPDLDVDVYKGKLRTLAGEIKSRIGDEKEPEKVIRIIGDYIYNARKEKNPNMDWSSMFINPRDKGQIDKSWLNVVLDSMDGNCIGFTTLYLGLSEELGVPFYGVSIPSHSFVRYDNGKKQRNIETTQKGENLSKEEYMDMIKENFRTSFSDDDINRGLYYRNLSKKEMVGLLLTQRGEFFYQNGKYELAVKDYQTVIELCHGFVETYNNLGVTYSELGKYDKAIEALNKAIKIRPKHVEAYYNLGGIYKDDLCQPDKAIMAYEEALRCNPEIASVYYNLGLVYEDLGNNDKAIGLFEKTIKYDKDHIKAYMKLALIYSAMGDDAKANEINRQIKNFSPPSGKANFISRFGLYYTNSDYESALAECNKALQINPKDVEAYICRGVVYEAQEKSDLALVDYNKAIELNPNAAKAYYNRGVLYARRSDYKQAEINFNKAVQINPNYRMALQALKELKRGLALDRRDNKDMVKEYLKAAEQGDAQAQYNLGVAYDKGIGVESDQKEAVKWYRKAAEQGHAQAQFELGLAYYVGVGIEKDEEEAIKWFNKSAQQGCRDAIIKLELIKDKNRK